MKNVTTLMKAHLASDTTTLCTIFKVTRTDGVTYRLTDYTSNIVFNNEMYEASNSYSASAVKYSSNLSVDNLEITGALNGVPTAISDVVTTIIMTDADIQAGIWDYAEIVMQKVNFMDLSTAMGSIFIKKGTIGQISTGRFNYNLELRGQKQPLQQKIGRVYTLQCAANLGDSNCRINLDDYTFNGTVNKVIDQHSWIDESLNQTNSTFQKNISNITNTNPIVVTCANHGLSSGEQVTFSEIAGMTQLNGTTIPIVNLTVNTFQIALNGTVFGTYAGGGKVTKKEISEYFKDGFVEWLTGNNTGLKFGVKTYNPNYVFLYDAAVFPIQVGDTYRISAGCDKLMRTCNGRFNNRLNYYGFNLIPGQDRMSGGT